MQAMLKPWPEQIYFTAPYFSGAQFYLRVRLGTQKMEVQTQSVRQIKKQLETLCFVLYYLNTTCGLHF